VNDSSKAIRWEGAISEQIYLRANRLNSRPSVSTLMAIGLLALMTSTSLVVPTSSNWTFLARLWEATWPFAVLLGLYVMFRISQIFGVKRAFGSNAALRSPMRGAATTEGVRLSWDHGTAELPWKGLFKATLSKDLVLLFQGVNLVYIVPRASFEDEGSWMAFVDLVRTNAPRPAHNKVSVLYRAFLWVGLIFALTVLFWTLLDR
jgi:hypothetical protein